MFPTDTHILVVDDIDGARQLVKSHLESLGFVHILEADSGRAAYELIETSEELELKIGLVILDWHMPDVSGIELLAALKKDSIFKDVPVLMVTAEAELSQVLKAIQSGASDYIVKPFSVDVLEQKLGNVWKKATGKA